MITFLTSSFIEYDPLETSNDSRKEYRLIHRNGFSARLREVWKDNLNLLFFSSDPDNYAMSDNACAKLIDVLNSANLTTGNVSVYDHRSKDSIDEALSHTDVLFLAGGHAPTQNRFMKECHLRSALKSFDGIIIALSAGSMNCSSVSYMIPELEGEATSPHFNNFPTGLGLVKFQFIPHSEFLKTLVIDGKNVLKDCIMPDSFSHYFFLIPDGSYIRIENGITEFFGNGEVVSEGRLLPLKSGIIPPSILRTRTSIWDGIMSEGYDIILLADIITEKIQFFHNSIQYESAAITPDTMGHFSEFCERICENFITPEERELFIKSTSISEVLYHLRKNNDYTVTVHFMINGQRRAKIFRAHFLNNDSRHILYTFKDISSALEHDWMTNEYARIGFLDQAEKVINKLDYNEEYSLVYANIFGFKAINDLFGQHGGDKVIFWERDILKKRFKPLLMGRSEADHFLLIINNNNLTPENLKAISSLTYEDNNKRFVFSIHLGIYPITDRTIPIDNMLDRAKLAEKSIRDDIHQKFALYTNEVHQDYLHQRVLISDFLSAVNEYQFQIYYQPVIDMRTDKICSAEALIRWHHPEYGMISPSEFIPLFEKNGHISALDSLIVNQVRDFTEGRIASGKKTVPCAVNLSRIDFYDTKLLESLIEHVMNTPYHPIPLKIEVTESAYANLENSAINFLENLRNNGIQILLDDFGSGMSSLSTLETFEFNVVKLDIGFISKIGKNQKSEAIIRDTIRLAHDLNAQVVAEGVENIQQWNFLKEADCDMVQGFFKYRPMPQPEFSSLLDSLL